MSARVNEVLEQGVAHLKAGRFDEAERICRGILLTEPEHSETLHTLGVLLYKTGRDTEAIRYLQQAIDASPDSASCHTNFGAALLSLDQKEEAARQLDQAICLDPLGQISDWFVASIIEAYLRNVHFSSLCAGSNLLPVYEILKSNPFIGPEMTRSQLLLRNRFSLPLDTRVDDRVYAQGPGNLNPEFWKANFAPDQLDRWTDQ